jgi:potassium uptake TrkH family protein
MKASANNRRFLILLQSVTIILIVYDLGFTHEPWLTNVYAIMTTLLFAANSVFLLSHRDHQKLAWLPLILLGFISILSLILWIKTGATEALHVAYLVTLGLYFLYRASISVQGLFADKFNPATLFVVSFALLILVGTLLLLLPNASTRSISVIDAAFTATSAVCVTGLIVVDTAKDFSFFGQLIILLLIQAGGLGMLTFTSFFAFYFKGGTSLQETLNLRDMVSSEQLGNVFKIVTKIIVFTLIIEVVGAALLYRSLPGHHFDSSAERLFFALFHAVSAFCNAGFSILSEGLYDNHVRFNYGLQWIVMVLIVLGGIGFNILSNYYEFLKAHLTNKIQIWLQLPHKAVPARIISINTTLVLRTTLLLLLAGALFFFFTESRHSLSGHQGFMGKITGALFLSVSPRTAGFNTIDMSMLSVPAVLMTMVLMWIGASPASTGGGIKTSTFAVAVLNVISIVKGRSHIEMNYREIPYDSVRRAFAIISLSVFVIGAGIILLSWLEPEKDLLMLSFEAISAYSTVGLSLGVTGQLSTGGKVVLIILMFVGRVGTINLLTGMLKRLQHIRYRYPEESILIN